MTKDKKQILRAVLEGYKTGKLTQDDVVLLLIEFNIMKANKCLKLGRINSQTLKRLPKNVTIILRGGN